MGRSRADVLRIGLFGDPVVITPILHLAEHGTFISNLVFAAPLKKDPSGDFVPDLFSTWASSMDENGRLVVEGVWRDNLRWHDGSPFDSRALAFTLKAAGEGSNQSPFAALASGVVSVDSFDRGRRTRIVFAGNSRQYLELLCIGLLPPHMLEGKSLSLENADFLAEKPEQATAPEKLFFDRPVGLGRYRVAAWEKGSFIDLKRWNPADPGSGTPDVGSPSASAAAPSVEGNGLNKPWNRILIRCYMALDDLVGDFRNGKLDWINCPGEISENFAEMKIPGLRFVRYANPGAMFLGFNLGKAPFDKAEVRKAIDSLIDRQKLKAVTGLEGTAIDGPPGVVPGSATPPVADPGSAREVLAKAGLLDGNGDGKLELQGKELVLSILVNQENIRRKLVGNSIVEALGKAGISAKVETVSWSEMIGRRLETKDFDSFILGGYFPGWGNWSNLLHSGSCPGASGTPRVGERLNFGGWADSAADQALDALDRVPPPASPAASRDILRERLKDERPILFLFQSFDVAVMGPDLSVPAPSGPIWDENPDSWRKGVGADSDGSVAPATPHQPASTTGDASGALPAGS